MRTHTQDVEAEALRDGFADQLIRQTVKADMSAQAEVPLLFVLQEHQTNDHINTTDTGKT